MLGPRSPPRAWARAPFPGRADLRIATRPCAPATPSAEWRTVAFAHPDASSSWALVCRPLWATLSADLRRVRARMAARSGHARPASGSMWPRARARAYGGSRAARSTSYRSSRTSKCPVCSPTRPVLAAAAEPAGRVPDPPLVPPGACPTEARARRSSPPAPGVFRWSMSARGWRLPSESTVGLDPLRSANRWLNGPPPSAHQPRARQG